MSIPGLICLIFNINNNNDKNKYVIQIVFT